MKEWEGQYNNWYRKRWARHYFSGERLNAMRYYGYDLPPGLQGRGKGFVAGGKDFVLGGLRNYRRMKKPLQISRFLRRFRKKHGFGVMFR
ncbi:MAG: hypothetical protein D6681_03390 [Calditrichaeota bacterium]|nr:MAG: hypothetical protein D6681_03390 [Calditrichota bacterium]